MLSVVLGFNALAPVNYYLTWKTGRPIFSEVGADPAAANQADRRTNIQSAHQPEDSLTDLFLIKFHSYMAVTYSNDYALPFFKLTREAEIYLIEII